MRNNDNIFRRNPLAMGLLKGGLGMMSNASSFDPSVSGNAMLSGLSTGLDTYAEHSKALALEDMARDERKRKEEMNQWQMAQANKKVLETPQGIMEYNSITGEATPIRDNRGETLFPQKQGTTVNVGQNTKAPTGYMWKDPSDLSQGVSAIKGGPAQKITGGDAGKVALIKEANKNIKDVQNIFFKKDGSLNKKNIAQISTGVHAPNSPTRLAEAKLMSAIRAKLRIESGAVISDEEAKSEMKVFIPSVFDSPETVREKGRMLENFLTTVEGEMMIGRKAKEEAPIQSDLGGQTVTNKRRIPQQQPQVNYAQQQFNPNLQQTPVNWRDQQQPQIKILNIRDDNLEGRTATNAQGQRIIMRNGQWESIE